MPGDVGLTGDPPFRPTRAQQEAAHGKGIRNVVAPGLDVLFCGINPGLYTAAIGHHFGRPGNRFWKVLHLAGFTPRELSPFEERELLRHGCGVTNLVNYATARADELDPDDLARGAARLRRTVRRHRPRAVAVLGMDAYRTAFGTARITVGRQEGCLGNAVVWVLPNPSGLQASYQLPDLVRLFRALRRATR